MMMWGLPPVPSSTAAGPGFALGLAAARRNHLIVSQRSSSNDRHGGAGGTVSRPSESADRAADHNLLRVGDVLIAINGVPTADQPLDAVVQRLLRLCHRNGTWATVGRPVGRLALAASIIIGVAPLDCQTLEELDQPVHSQPAIDDGPPAL